MVILTTHSITASAAPDVLLDLVADAEGAPRYAPSHMHAECTGPGIVRRWAYAGEQLRSWEFRRVVDRAGRTITFEHVAPAPPVLSQRGQWSFRPSGGGTSVEVTHTIEPADPSAAAGLRAGLDRNVPAQLAMYKEVAEIRTGLAAHYVTRTETVTLPGTVEGVVDRLLEGDLGAAWYPRRASTEVTPLAPDVSLARLTVAGRPLARYFRLARPGEGVRYKRLDTREGVRCELGSWIVRPSVGGMVDVVLEHHVTLDLDRPVLPSTYERECAAVTAGLHRIAGALAEIAVSKP